MRKLPSDFDDIPLGHAIFLLGEYGKGAEVMPELTTFQVDGRIFDVNQLDAEFFDDDLIASLNHLRNLLKAKAEEWPT